MESNTAKQVKKRRKTAKRIRIKNWFFTSRSYMTFHLLQTLTFWSISILFPSHSVVGCVYGHNWMSHIAITIFLLLSLIFDFAFASQYIANQ